ncbi:hypothetical protein B0O99DRAFT_682168 [Bisporella sp. PMI_857]|nr:hypothetical protein B0O99DRAFT_682824 [Bisporella sp. PMI_857]KAH8600483.1 hypothetical protein B0O99DRAFT_682168 [Bisporella sp. PMI_857]
MAVVEHSAFSFNFVLVLLVCVGVALGDVASALLTKPFGCGTFNNGLTPLTCASTYASLNAIPTAHSTPATVTITKTGTATSTLTLYLSEIDSFANVSSIISSPPPITSTTTTNLSPITTVPSSLTTLTRSTANGLCLWAKQNVLTPCTEQVEGTAAPKKSHANSAMQNVIGIVYKRVCKTTAGVRELIKNSIDDVRSWFGFLLVFSICIALWVFRVIHNRPRFEGLGGDNLRIIKGILDQEYLPTIENDLKVLKLRPANRPSANTSATLIRRKIENLEWVGLIELSANVYDIQRDVYENVRAKKDKIVRKGVSEQMGGRLAELVRREHALFEKTKLMHMGIIALYEDLKLLDEDFEKENVGSITEIFEGSLQQ